MAKQQTDPPVTKQEAIYNALSKDDKYKDFIPDNLAAFNERLSDPKVAGSVYETLSKDDKYSEYLPDSIGFVNIFKKKRTDATSSNGLETPSKPDGKPISENGAKAKGEPVTDRFGISSKLPTAEPPSIDVVGTNAKIKKTQQLQQDIKSIEASDNYKNALAQIKSLNEDIDVVNNLYKNIGDIPSQTDEQGRLAYNARIDAANEQRDKYLQKADEASDARNLIDTHDNYVSEYNDALSKIPDAIEPTEQAKTQSMVQNLVWGTAKTLFHDLGASLDANFVAEQRTHEGVYDHFKSIRKAKAQGKKEYSLYPEGMSTLREGSVINLDDIDLSQTDAWKADIIYNNLDKQKNSYDIIAKELEGITREDRRRAGLESDADEKRKKRIAGIGRTGVGPYNPYQSLSDEDFYKLKAEKTKEARNTEIGLDKLNVEFSEIMSPVVKATAPYYASVIDKAANDVRRGEARFGQYLVDETKDVNGLYTGLLYTAAQMGLSSPYSVFGLAFPVKGSIDIETGSIAQDLYGKLKDKTGLSTEEIMSMGIDSEGMDHVIEGGIEAGLLEYAAEGLTIGVGFLKFGKGIKGALKAKEKISKSGALSLFKMLGAVATGAGGEALTEGMQTRIELESVLRGLKKDDGSRYTEEEISEMITWEDLREAVWAGGVAGGGISMSSITVNNLIKSRQTQTTEELVSQEQAKVDTENIKAVDDAAERIQKKADEEDKKPPPPGAAGVVIPEQKIEAPTGDLGVQEETVTPKIGFRVLESSIPKGQTAQDVVDFEAEELGNKDIQDQAKEKGIDLTKEKSEDLIWLTKTEKDAERYAKTEDGEVIGEIDEITIPEGSTVIAEEEDGGMLILLNNKKQTPKAETSTESTQHKTDSALTEDALDENVIYTSKSGATITRNEDGGITVLKKDGTEYTPRGRLNVVNEYLSETDRDSYEKTTIPEGLNDTEINSYIIEHSKNPVEVAQAYVATMAQKDFMSDPALNDAKFDAINAHGIKITEQEFLEETVKDNLTPKIRKLFIEGNERYKKYAIPEIAEAISNNNEEDNLIVTSADIVNYMLSFNEKEQRSTESVEAQQLSEKFQALTGKKLTPAFAEAFAYDDNKKASPKTVAKATEIDVEIESGRDISLADWVAYENELKQSIKDDGQRESKKAANKKDAAKAPQQDRGDGSRAETLKEKEKQIKDELSALFGNVGKTKGAMTGIHPDELVNAARIIAKAVELGYNTIEQIIEYARGVVPTWLSENMDTLKEAYKLEDAKKKSPPKSKVSEKSTPEETKARLENRIRTDNESQSDYIKRRTKDLRDTPEFREKLDGLGEYNQISIALANTESDRFIADMQNEFGEKQGLLEAFKASKEGYLPKIMMGQVGAKLHLKMVALGMFDNAIAVADFEQFEFREASYRLLGAKSDSSPEQTVSRLFAGLGDEKKEALNREFKDGSTYNQALEEMKKRLKEVEDAYNELLKSGKIKESWLPDPVAPKKPTARSKQLRERAKALRKEGIADLNKYFKSGTISMGVRVDANLITGLAKVLQSYILEFEGNVLAAFDKFKTDVAKNYKEISKEDIDSFKEDIIKQSEEVINEFKDEKKRQVVNDILKPKGKETKEQRKSRKDAADNIVNDHNEGKTNNEIAENLSEIAGFEKISPEETKEILDLTQTYSEHLSQGRLILAKNAWNDLMIRLGELKLKSRTIPEIILDLWYVGVLSGLTTLARSLKGSSITALMHTATRMIGNIKAAPFMFSQMVKGSKGSGKAWAHVIRTGNTDIQIMDFTTKLPSLTYEVWRKQYKNLSNSKKVAKTIYAIPTFIFRNILALDQVIKNILSESNLALYEFKQTDKGKTVSQRVAEAKLALAEDRNEEVRLMVDEEIEEMKKNNQKIPHNYANMRFREIKNSMRDSEFVKKAFFDSAEAAMVSTPRRSLGKVYNAWINAVEVEENDKTSIKAGKLILKGIFPFIRISFNWINAGLDYTPIGFKRSFNENTWTSEGDQKIEAYEKQELITRASIGLLLGSSIIASMFDWDDDEGFKMKDEKDQWIVVYGPLSGNYWEYQDVAADAQPWSFKVKNPFTGKWGKTIKYQDNPIGFILAPIGMMHDEMMFKDFKKEVQGKEKKHQIKKLGHLIGAFTLGTWVYAMDKSFNSGVKQLGRIFAPKEEEKLQDNIIALFMRPIEGFVPGFYKQTFNQYKAVRDIPEKQYQEWYEKPARMLPFVDGILKNDKVDVFGYPMVRDFDMPLVPDIILKMAKDNLNYRETYKEWKLVWKYPEVIIGRTVAPDIDNGYKLTNDDKDKFLKDSGIYLREKVAKDYDYLNTLNSVNLQKALSLAKSSARAYAKSKIKRK